jgi:acetylornithine aminotransferase
MDNAFFCNSGAEANECAIKLARLYGHQRGVENATIIVMEKAWHGRTLATLSATGSRKAQAGFEPLMGGFLRVPYNDFAAVERLADNGSIVAVLLEVLQGEGGIHVADAQYVRKLREICDRKQWLLMIDEVQSGIGRTGKWFAHQWMGVVPDVMPLAKGLGSGVPIGACLARGAAAKVFKPGNHGTTFGGGPLVSVAAITTLDVIEKEGLMKNAEAMGRVIVDGLERSLAGEAGVKEIRGMGLMIGVELDRPWRHREAGARRGPSVIDVTARQGSGLLPPLVIRKNEAEMLVEIRPAREAVPGAGAGRRRGVKHFLQLKDLQREEFEHLFRRTRHQERFRTTSRTSRSWTACCDGSRRRRRARARPFEAAIHQLGGSSIVLNTSETQLGRASPSRTWRVISRMVDIVMIRTFEHSIIERFARSRGSR